MTGTCQGASVGGQRPPQAAGVGRPRPPQGAGAGVYYVGKGDRDPSRSQGGVTRTPQGASFGGTKTPSRSWGGGPERGQGGPGALRAAGRGSRGLGAAGRRFQPDALWARTPPWRLPRAEGTARARHVRQGVPREGQHQHQGLGPVSAAPGPRRDPRRAGGTRGARPWGRGGGRRCPGSSCFHPRLVIRSHRVCISLEDVAVIKPGLIEMLC